MDNLIKVQVFRNEFYEAWRYCGPVLPYETIKTNYEAQGEEWQVPYAGGNGIADRYERQTASSAPTTDSVRTVKLFDPQTGRTMWILGTLAQYTDLANACCGTTGTMDSVSIPSVATIEDTCGITPLLPGSTVYPMAAAFSGPLLSGQKVQLSGNKDGVAFSPAPLTAGYASRDAALTWANSNWSAYGTFVAVGDYGIRLDANFRRGNFGLELLAQPYCMTVVAGNTFNQVQDGNNITTLDQTYTVATAQQVIDIISSYFADGTLTAFSSTKINYSGTNKPGGILLNGVAVTSFTAGACA